MCRHLVRGHAISVLNHCVSGISSLTVTYTTPDSGLTYTKTCRPLPNCCCEPPYCGLRVDGNWSLVYHLCLESYRYRQTFTHDSLTNRTLSGVGLVDLAVYQLLITRLSVWLSAGDLSLCLRDAYTFGCETLTRYRRTAWKLFANSVYPYFLWSHIFQFRISHPCSFVTYGPAVSCPALCTALFC